MRYAKLLSVASGIQLALNKGEWIWINVFYFQASFYMRKTFSALNFCVTPKTDQTGVCRVPASQRHSIFSFQIIWCPREKYQNFVGPYTYFMAWHCFLIINFMWRTELYPSQCFGPRQVLTGPCISSSPDGPLATMVSCTEFSAGATICSLGPSSCGFDLQEVPSSCNMKNKLWRAGVEVGRWLGGYWSIQVITWLRVSSGDGDKWRALVYLGGTSHRRGEDEGQGRVKDNSWVSELDDWRDSGCMALFTFNLSLIWSTSLKSCTSLSQEILYLSFSGLAAPNTRPSAVLQPWYKEEGTVVSHILISFPQIFKKQVY